MENEEEVIRLLTSIDARLGFIFAVLLVVIVVKFLWIMFDKWFFGQ